jgi:hypothetical protein
MTPGSENAVFHIMFRLKTDGSVFVTSMWPDGVEDAHLRAAARGLRDEVERRRIARATASLVLQPKKTRRTRRGAA